MRRAFSLLFSFVTVAVLSGACYAAAWTLPQGQSQLITNLLYYETSEGFSRGGDRVDQPRFSKWEINPYYEYGYADGLTVGLSPFLHYLEQEDAAGSEASNWGLAETEVFARYRIYEQNGTAVALQPTLKLPSLYSDDEPKAGRSQMDGELALQAGTKFILMGREHYTSASAGYRHRLGNLGDQWRLNAVVGINLCERWQFLPQVSWIGKAGDTNADQFSVSGQNDYDLTKIQFTAVYTINERYGIEFGGFSHVDGNNTGAGGGILTSLWARW